MMPVDFPSANFTFTKPANMTDEQCSDLRVWRGPCAIDDKGNTVPVIVSCWKLNREELDMIKETGEVWLSITGEGMPPVSVFIENPFIPTT